MTYRLGLLFFHVSWLFLDAVKPMEYWPHLIIVSREVPTPIRVWLGNVYPTLVIFQREADLPKVL
jgi:hypothetical protein